VPALREVGEAEAIRLLTRGAGASEDIVVGPGDDAAVLRPAPGEDLVATTDAMVEGRHYLSSWLTPRGRGARLAAINLSDIAAMAARPRWALLSVGARPDHDLDALLDFQAGLAEALAAEGAAIAGGNLVAVRGEEWWSLTLLGAVARERAWRRAGARPGDLLALTGHPGRAAAGFLLAHEHAEVARESMWRPLLEAWLHPRARTAFAHALAPAGVVSAAIDVSDGLAGDLARMCDASGMGCDVEAWSLPEDSLISRASGILRRPVTPLRLGPSDDYELLLAVDARGRAAAEQAARETQTPISFIGRFTPRPGELALVEVSGARTRLAPHGFDHFAGAR
jgi:thiamine-monophosphate kinase